MGLGRKVAGSGLSWWLLLLAGVLLAVAATTTTAGGVEDGAANGEAAYGGTQRMCEIKCAHHRDPVNKQRCIDYCIKYQLTVAAATTAAGGVEENNDGATAGEAAYGGTQHMCELKCAHHHDPVNKQRCIDYCIKYQLTVAYGGTQHMCELKCAHHHDPVNKQRCIDYCIKYQLTVVGEGSYGAAAEAIRQVV